MLKLPKSKKLKTKAKAKAKAKARENKIKTKTKEELSRTIKADTIIKNFVKDYNYFDDYVLMNMISRLKQHLVRYPIIPDYEIKDLLELANNVRWFYQNKPNGYHIDHIVPYSWFNNSVFFETAFCWNINNLQYITKEENLSKGARLEKLEFMELCIKNEIIKVIIKVPSKVPEKFIHLRNHLTIE